MKRTLLLLLPLVLLAALVAVFALNIDRDPNYIPSVLIDRPAPQFALPAIDGLDRPGFDTDALRGEPTLVNVFASWCIPCRDEHPVLTRLKAETGIRLFGINQKDAPENARAFLAELGNPYDAAGADANGRVSIEWGVYGVPETFLLDANGVIVLKIVGPLSDRAVETVLKPAIARARGSSSP